MKNFSIELKWGIIFIISGILWVWLEVIFGLHDVYIAQHPLYTNFFGIIAVVIYILALREKKLKFFKNEMSWKEGFTSGIVLTIIITILSPLSQYIVYTLISPQYFENIISYSVENNRMTREQAETYFSLRSYMIQATFGALVMGVVTAAVVAWFVKTKRVE
ncbi:DUF4199 domain-containing protein [Antarcticibacterium flavum]|uniref:DUF4199 domain-containing protein n=1 Tax=Antarcticibacterium flavum TaxID=2058175 RepID=A0A5B7WZV2_9FLAO|nr:MULTISPECIES: DUF4199 domain-containing protein [Antarcticibacterium]MCM4160770.1 DUF4199 domain-containing protein [Antarcticibacterium sp. W02-3]QCY68756.1 DUF4199 domain-containing protein [Antarcticibacterium flavum]